MSETETLLRRPAVPGTVTVTDSLGRALQVQRLDALAELDLAEAAGPLGVNARWFAMASVAACVRSIDGFPLPFPNNRGRVRSHVATVGAEGIAAAMTTLSPDEQQAAGGTEAELSTEKN